MTKFIANLAILTAAFFATLGNFWFTYGIWPQSWTSFTIFFFITIALMLIREAVSKEK